MSRFLERALAAGSVERRAWSVEEEIASRPLPPLPSTLHAPCSTLELDRLLDGAVARAAACYTPGTYTERRRRRPDLAGASDAIEARLDALYPALLEGRGSLEAFQQALAEWVDVEGSYG